MEKVQDDQFITIHGWMRTRLGLKTNELFLYALIYGYNWSSKKEFYGSIKYMQEWLGIGSDRTIRTALKELCAKELLLKRTQNTEVGTRVYYRINPALLPLKDGTPNPLWEALNPKKATSLPRLEAAASELDLPTPLEINTSLKDLPKQSVNITAPSMQNLPESVVENDDVGKQNLPDGMVESADNNNKNINSKIDNENDIEKNSKNTSPSAEESKAFQEGTDVKAGTQAIDYSKLISDYDASTNGGFMEKILATETFAAMGKMAKANAAAVNQDNVVNAFWPDRDEKFAMSCTCAKGMQHFFLTLCRKMMFLY